MSSCGVIRAAGRPRGVSWRSEQRSEVRIVWRDALAFMFPVPVPSPFPHPFFALSRLLHFLFGFQVRTHAHLTDTIHLDLLARAVLAYHSSLQAQCPFYDWVSAHFFCLWFSLQRTSAIDARVSWVARVAMRSGRGSLHRCADAAPRPAGDVRLSLLTVLASDDVQNFREGRCQAKPRRRHFCFAWGCFFFWLFLRCRCGLL